MAEPIPTTQDIQEKVSDLSGSASNICFHNNLMCRGSSFSNTGSMLDRFPLIPQSTCETSGMCSEKLSGGYWKALWDMYCSKPLKKNKQPERKSEYIRKVDTVFTHTWLIYFPTVWIGSHHCQQCEDANTHWGLKHNTGVVTDTSFVPLVMTEIQISGKEKKQKPTERWCQWRPL